MPETLLILRFLLAAILYTFLGLTLYVLWRGLQEEAKTVSGIPPRPARLYSEKGTDISVDLQLQLVTAIGRAVDNTLTLDDPYVSAHHALILWREGRWWIEDLNSHNGTFLNDEKVTRPMPLTSGDTLLIGKTTMTFEASTWPLSESNPETAEAREPKPRASH
ncbi:MAG: FHA domain-containing protein [Anaerolineae bacterium]